jgi:3-hydroxy acid dehydrogenase / malonic semialdehyde reductase
MNLSLITGASSGIGEATARQLAQSGHHVWLVARREERLKKLVAELKSQGQYAEYSVLDITQRNAVALWATQHKNQIERVRVLINNAGLAKGVAPLQNGEISDWEQMIDTNLKGLLYMTRAVLPGMCAAGDGHIINIGSVAGRWAYPGGNVYCATKSAVHSLSESLRMDLLGKGIRVTEIVPGMVETEFSEVRLGDRARAKAVYAGVVPLTAHDVAESVDWCINRPKHVNVQEIVIYPSAQAAPGQVFRRP